MTIHTTAQRLTGSGFFQLLALTICVQGVPLVAQFAAGRLLAPATFGHVRVAESVLSTLLVASAVGMPTLVVREIALAPSDAERRARLLAILRLAAVIGVVMAAAASSALLVLENAYPAWLVGLVWVAALANLSRCLINFFVGLGRVTAVAWPVLLVSLAALATIVASVAWKGESGWMPGRLVGELALLVVVGVVALRVVGNWPPAAPMPGAAGLLGQGAWISGNLAVRSLTENAPLVLLPLLAAPAAEIGLLGLAMLLATALLLIPATFAALLLPRLTKATLATPAAFARTTWNWCSRQGAIGTALGATAWLLAYLLLPYFLPAYAGVERLFAPLAVAVGLKAVSITLGTALTALGRQRPLAACNIASLVLNSVAVVLSFAAAGASAVPYGVLFAEAMTTAILAGAMRFAGRSSNDPMGSQQ